MTANAYPLIKKFIEGELSEDELIAKMSTIDWRLAKRQITFMKRNKNIRWLDLAEANTYLNNEIKKQFPDADFDIPGVAYIQSA